MDTSKTKTADSSQFKKYASVFSACFKASFIADLEFRANFLTRIFTDIFWYLAQIMVFETLFLHTKKIGDLNHEQVRVFLGVLFVVDAIYMILFSENLDKIPEFIRKGQLDLLLTKPINSHFMVSLQRANTALIGNLLIALGWFIWSLSAIHMTAEKVLALIILIPCGVAAFYSGRFFFACLSVLLTKAENLMYIWYQLYRLGQRPDSVYSFWIKWALRTVIPLALVGAVPAQNIIEDPNWGLILFVVIWMSLMIWALHKFWFFCLRNYTSASS